MRIALLARVSSQEQKRGYSIEAQRREIHRYCEARSYAVVDEYVDEGYTGRNLNRPEIKRLITDARKDKFDAIVLHKFDRLARNRVDAGMIKTLFRKDLGIKIYSVSEVSEDEDQVSGGLNEGMLEVVADWYSRNLGAETCKGKKERALNGKYNGVLSFGYQRVPKEQGGIPIFHPTNIEGYWMAIRMAAEGRTVREIMNALNAAGYQTTGNRGNNPFSLDTVLPMLKNRFYLGEVCYKGQWFAGKHSPAIDRETWERAQEQLRRRASRRETTKLTDAIYPLRKKLYCCGCRRRLRGHNQHGNKCYRCPSASYGERCPECRDVKSAALETQIGEWLAHLKLPEDWQSQVLDRIGTADESVRKLRKRIAMLTNRLERLRQQHSWGHLKDEDYLSKYTDTKRELSSVPVPPQPDLARARQWLQNLAAIWERAYDLERLKLADALIEKAWVHTGRIVALEPRPALYQLMAGLEAGDGLMILPPQTDYRT